VTNNQRITNAYELLCHMRAGYMFPCEPGKGADRAFRETSATAAALLEWAAARLLHLWDASCGKDRPPTDAEIAAHDAVGGLWLVTRRGDHVLVGGVDDVTATRAETPEGARWLAVGRDGTTRYGWPTVKGVAA
jgi:hypothetical protein